MRVSKARRLLGLALHMFTSPCWSCALTHSII